VTSGAGKRQVSSKDTGRDRYFFRSFALQPGVPDNGNCEGGAGATSVPTSMCQENDSCFLLRAFPVGGRCAAVIGKTDAYSSRQRLRICPTIDSAHVSGARQVKGERKRPATHQRALWIDRLGP
jgi:hypothetical protein